MRMMVEGMKYWSTNPEYPGYLFLTTEGGGECLSLTPNYDGLFCLTSWGGNSDEYSKEEAIAMFQEAIEWLKK